MCKQSNRVQPPVNNPPIGNGVENTINFANIIQQNVNMDACKKFFSNLPADADVLYFYANQDSKGALENAHALVVYIYKKNAEEINQEGQNGNPLKIAWEEVNGTMANTPDLYNRRMKWLSYLEYRKEFPIYELPEEEQKAFNVMLGAGYVAALTNIFEEVENAKKTAFDYAWSRLLGRTRHQSNKIASLTGIITLIILSAMGGLFWSLSYNIPIFAKENHIFVLLFEWVTAILAGVLGAVVSIWNVNKSTEFANYFSEDIIKVRTRYRLCVGAILALIAAACYHVGVIKILDLPEGVVLFTIIGFIAGYSERWIMGIVDKIASGKEK